VKNPAHHLFANMYIILRHYSLTIRYVVTGRKPGIDDDKRRRRWGLFSQYMFGISNVDQQFKGQCFEFQTRRSIIHDWFL